MWNPMKSVRLSMVCTKLVMLLVAVCMAFMPLLFERYMDYALIPLEIGSRYPLMAILYLCCVPAMAALVCLHVLLGNIKKGRVFVSVNVKLLRAISWCCFAAAAIMAVAGCYHLLFGLMAVAVAFIGLILRVVKNVIEEAARIKAENDYTI